jgi:hypothetical protein
LRRHSSFLRSIRLHSGQAFSFFSALFSFLSVVLVRRARCGAFAVRRDGEGKRGYRSAGGFRASLRRIHYSLFNCNANAIVHWISYESLDRPSSAILTQPELGCGRHGAADSGDLGLATAPFGGVGPGRIEKGVWCLGGFQPHRDPGVQAACSQPGAGRVKAIGNPTNSAGSLPSGRRHPWDRQSPDGPLSACHSGEWRSRKMYLTPPVAPRGRQELLHTPIGARAQPPGHRHRPRGKVEYPLLLPTCRRYSPPALTGAAMASPDFQFGSFGGRAMVPMSLKTRG